MSYRTLKKVLGETSLERKCRFLFGGGLMLLITGSFWFYAQLNLSLISEQDRERAKLLIQQRLLYAHWEAQQRRLNGDPSSAQEHLSLLEDVRLGSPGEPREPAAPRPEPEYRWNLFSAKPTTAEAAGRPDETYRYEAADQIISGRTDEVVLRDPDSGDFEYFGAVRAADSCVACHRGLPGGETLGAGDLLGVARIDFSLSETERTIAKNNALLIVMAIVTASLAMLAAYAIVRYVIVKPVLHLKDVSDSIAQGDLDQRADIRTGDEFEELSLAFNRMLRYLVHMQEDLQKANGELDAKVDELALANLGLFDAMKVKGDFLATMSHELRTPLNSILGFSEVLAAAENLTDRQKRYVTNIDGSGRNLLALINDILDLAKLESGKMAPQVSEFAAADLVERQAAAIEPMAAKKNIQLTTDVDPALPRLEQDAGKLQQILTNLLSNAVKFTPEGGRVHVSAKRDGEDLVLAVDDTGIGIPLDEQAQVFEKFRQGAVSESTADPLTREHEGTGLGLSIVRELSRNLGGEVTLDSEFGKGSTFTVRVPLRLAAETQAAA